MSISYQSKDSAVLGLQLKVQELCLVSGDAALSDDGADSVVDVKETIGEVRAVLHVIPGSDVAALASTKSGSQITIAGVVLAAGEALIVKYVVAE